MNAFWFRRWKNQIKKWFKELRGSKSNSFAAQYKTCPSCGKFVGSNDAICEYCQAPVAHLQVSTGRFDESEEGSSVHLETTYALFGLCTFFFALTAILNYQTQRVSSEEFGLFDQLRAYILPAGEAFSLLGASTTVDIIKGEYWRLFTYMFLHGNLLHIIFNLSALAFLGPLLFGVFGLRRFWLLTLGCGAAGAVSSIMGHWLVFHSGSSVVGLSAALFGYLGALYAYYRGTGDLSAAEKFKSYMIWGNVVCIIVTLLGMPIDNFAHLGGMLTGWGWGKLMFRNASTKAMLYSERLLLSFFLGTWLFGCFLVLRTLISQIQAG